MSSWRLRWVLFDVATLYQNSHSIFFPFQVDAGTIVTTIQKLLAPDTAKQHRK